MLKNYVFIYECGFTANDLAFSLGMNDVECVEISEPAEAESIFKDSCTGSACVVSGVKFEWSFMPNSVVELPESRRGDMEWIVKQVKWTLSGFGRGTPDLDGVYFTSDTHFFHENIIKYCDRPFKSVDEMNEALVENWNAVVPYGAQVWHLGDFSFGGKDNVDIVRRLNGRINLVLGNHDRRDMQFYYDKGFCRVYDKPVLLNNFIALSHEPLQWVQEPMFNVFGHVHDNPNYATVSKRGFCACVERHGYRPVSWKEIKKLVESA